MWRYDAGRTAASPGEIPRELDLLWVREYSPREPVWDDPLNRDLMPYDRVFEPVVMGKRMFVPFNDSDKLVCLDTDTGEELWSFYADGPVRLPPVAWRGKVYFCSDDGSLYCLRAETGELVWRHVGAPSARKVLGNGRLISTWPARGGPVLKAGRVYYAASIWPFMGTFIYALDAETGEVAWLNDSTGAQYIMQPHSSPAFAGVAPQGAFVVAGERLLVPGGRSVPACFDLATGGFLYYRLSENGKTGGSFVCALGDVFFNHYRERVTNMYDVGTGNRLAMRVGRHPVPTDEAFFFSARMAPLEAKMEPPALPTGGKAALPSTEPPILKEYVVAYDPEALAGYLDERSDAELWRLECDASGDLIRAGGCLYAVGNRRITAIQLSGGRRPAKVAWTKSVRSEVGRLLAADGKLFAVSLDGTIMAFGRGPKRTVVHSKAAARLSERGHEKARRILEQTGVSEGYALVWGTEREVLLEALATNSKLRIVAVSPHAGRVEGLRRHMRRHLDWTELYGRRVAVFAGEPSSFGAPPYVASLTVLGDLEGKDREASLKAVYRSVRPYGGKVWCEAGTATARALSEMSRRGEFAGAKALSRPGAVIIERAGPLAGSAPWTHQYGDIANTVKSDDKLVKLPLGLLWFGGNSNMDVLPRHGHGPPEQVIGGRLFIEGIDLLSARDVYTGRVLWKAKLDGLGNYGVYYDKTYKNTPTSTAYNQVHLPGANIRGTNFVATEDRVYVAHGSSCHVLDAATGKRLREIRLPRARSSRKRPTWAYIGVYGEKILAGAGFVPFAVLMPREEEPSPWTEFDRSASRGLVAMDRRTGEVKWRVDALHGFLHNGIAAGGGKVFCLDRLPPYVAARLARRGQEPGTAWLNRRPGPSGGRARRGLRSRAGSRIVALDVDSGRTVWETNAGVFGTWLSYSEERDILLQAARPSRDMVRGEYIRRMSARRGRDGKLLWDRPGYYGGPPILHGDRIITSGAMFSLLTGERMTRRNPLTGEEAEWVYKRTYGCNSVIGGEHILTFRSAAAGYYDLARDGGTGNFGGFKSGCTSNLVAADGVLNAPDYTRTCSCSYQNQTSLALVHDPEVEIWTTFAARPPETSQRGPIRKIGINFGAPGDRRDEQGTYWVEYPMVGGPSPAVLIDVEPNDVKYFRIHSSRVQGDGPGWVAASGLLGVAKIRIDLGEWRGVAAEGSVRVASGSDDAEESAEGEVRVGSSGLEMVQGRSRQIVGMRFVGVELDRGARLTDAYVQFKVNEKSRGGAELIIHAEATDDAARFAEKRHDVSSRPRTRVSARWWPGSWREVGASGSRQRTPDIAAVIREVIGRPGWKRGNAIAIIVTGIGGRAAQSFEKSARGAPRLVVKTRREDRGGLRRYTVRLHFGEPHDVGVGGRVFDVSIQGKKVLKDFDVVKAAGGARRPVVRTFRGIGVKSSLEVELRPGRAGGRAPLLCGIEALAEDGRARFDAPAGPKAGEARALTGDRTVLSRSSRE